MAGLSKITNWKEFERLCADLLAAEGTVFTFVGLPLIN
jgi:hypothetical protein